MARAVEVTVRGQVQGVSYRGFTAREAVRLELSGWVRNEADGSVTVHVEGPDDAVAEMVTWCRQGSPDAEVEAAAIRDVEPADVTSFEVQY